MTCFKPYATICFIFDRFVATRAASFVLIVESPVIMSVFENVFTRRVAAGVADGAIREVIRLKKMLGVSELPDFAISTKNVQ